MSAAVDIVNRLPGWPRLLDRAMAAAYLGVSVWQIDDWRREGVIPDYLRGMKRFDRNAIDAAIDRLSGRSAAIRADDVIREAANAQRQARKAKAR